MDEPTLKQYIDMRIDTLQGEVDRRFATVLREMEMLVTAHHRDVESRFAGLHRDMESKFVGHNELHAREREALADFKSSSEQWRTAANEFRSQLTKERGDYLMRKEIWAMLAATGGAIVTAITVVYFIIYAVHGGK